MVLPALVSLQRVFESYVFIAVATRNRANEKHRAKTGELVANYIAQQPGVICQLVQRS